ncbi:MAG: serine endopeptidase [Neisseria sp.]|nr:serine endopeptidase [Neisseria sp.]
MKIKRQASSNAKSSRLTEVWFRRGLWLISLIFASFLIGLGGKIIGDLPQADNYKPLEHYLESPQHTELVSEQTALQQADAALGNELEQARLALQRARSQINAEQESLDNWLRTRRATGQADNNAEVLRRTQAVDALKQEENRLGAAYQAIQQRQLDNNQAQSRNQGRLNTLTQAAESAKAADDRRIELRIFLYRLALTLPLLLVGGYLFAKQRKSRWWPFVWGFIFFALFAFFVELVPYLPSYGGYVRYITGIVLVLVIGRYAIGAMNAYLARKQAEEALPAPERRQQMDYDAALQRVAKSICPGCERPLDYQTPEMDYCPHCRLQLFKTCQGCQSRKSAFNRYCYRCGTADETGESSSADVQTASARQSD